MAKSRCDIGSCTYVTARHLSRIVVHDAAYFLGPMYDEIRSGRASKKHLNRVALAEALEFIITGISGAQGLFGVALCL